MTTPVPSKERDLSEYLGKDRDELRAIIGERDAEIERLQSDVEGTRDMLTDARIELDMLRAALGVDYEPHQNLMERMLDAANHKRVANGNAEILKAIAHLKRAAQPPSDACERLCKALDFYVANHTGLSELILAVNDVCGRNTPTKGDSRGE